MAEATFWLPENSVLSGRYHVQEVLGVGGYGITYRAMDDHLDRVVAVKEYYPGFCASRFAARTNFVSCLAGYEAAYEKGLSAFRSEARTLVQLSSIHATVLVLDFFEENDTAYIVMEFLNGKNLKQMMSGFGGRIPVEVLLPTMEPAIRALGAVHRLGLIHRDISPDNIMMLEDGSVRVIDFGNARETEGDKTMTMAMKQGFAPPEQYQTHGQGPYTDVYSLCATMYYCLTGKLPPQPMDRLTGTPFPLPSELGVAIDPVIEQAIMDGMELYVQKRIQDTDELWQRLYTAASTPVQTPSNPSVADPEPIARTTPSEQYVLPMGTIKPLPIELALNSGLNRIRSLCAQIYRKVKESYGDDI